MIFDLETHLIQPGCTFPRIVCGAFEQQGHVAIVDRRCTLEVVSSALAREEPLAGHWVAFDLGCVGAASPDLMPAIFSHYRKGLVSCTQVRSWLLDAAHGMLGKLGPYSLSRLHERAIGSALAKGEDTWRLRYAELDGIPIEAWPPDARTYVIGDVEAARRVYDAQEKHLEWLEDQHRQARYYFALSLVAGWGLVTDPAKVDAFEDRYRTLAAELRARVVDAGLVRADGTRDKKKTVARVLAAYAGREVPRTAKGGVKTDASTCRESGDPILQAYGELGPVLSQLSKNVPILRSGIVHTKFGFAATGRTTSGDGETTDDTHDDAPNTQNLDGKSGVRECFVPRPGYVYASADYGSLELCTLAQVELELFGTSKLADVLNAGEDPHSAFAGVMMGIPYPDAVARHERLDEAFERVRDVCKIGNFGFPGGLGAGAFVAYAFRKSGGKVRITEAEAREYRRAWFRRWELDRYFAHVDHIVNTTGLFQFARANRWRGRVGYTDGCNGYFQARGSDVGKSAVAAVVEATFTRGSPLWGSHVVNFVHDDIAAEVPDDHRAAPAAEEMSRIMVEQARVWIPDVRIKAAPLLARYLSKKAKPLRDSSGVLIPWG